MNSLREIVTKQHQNYDFPLQISFFFLNLGETFLFSWKVLL